jgi:hypothetical protein
MSTHLDLQARRSAMLTNDRTTGPLQMATMADRCATASRASHSHRQFLLLADA